MTSILLRLFLYCAWVAVIALGVVNEGYQQGTAATYGEASLVEYLQSGCLLVVAALFWLAARTDDRWRGVCMILVFVAGAAAVREQDSFFDHKVFDGAWQLTAATLLLAMALWWWRYPGSVLREAVTFEQSRGAGVLLAGFLTVFVFSRIIGQQSFWRSILGDGYVRVAKNFVEEGVELFGYSLLVVGASETLLQLRRFRTGAAGSGAP